jgi:bacillolysin
MFGFFGRGWTQQRRNDMHPRRRVTVTVSLLALIATLLPSGISAAQSIRSSHAQSGPRIEVRVSEETGKVSFLGSSPGASIQRPASVSASDHPASIARSFMDRFGDRFGVRNQATDLSVESVDRVTGGRSVVRFQQLHQGIPVIGGELIVNLDSSGDLLSANGEVVPSVRIGTEPQVGRNGAESAALAQVARAYSVSKRSLAAATPKLWIYDSRILGGPGLGVPRLVWRTEVTGEAATPIDEFVLVDAQLGSVALNFSQIAHAKNRTVCDANSTAGHLPCVAPVRTEGGPVHAVADVNDAYDFAGDTYDFFFGLGRDSLDDAGMTLVSTVRYCPAPASCPYKNAFWNGKQMVYGAGYTADDVVAHELAHGVTDFSSSLFYYYQSGAINESLSDVFGELMDLGNGAGNDSLAVRWLIGEDIPGGAIRNMKDPGAFGDPDKMTSPNYTADLNELDAGGVHSNSGVNNKATFLMTDGGTFNGKTVTGLGIPKTSRIYYEAAVNMLTSASDYGDLAAALQQSCNNLVGLHGITTANCVEVGDAIAAVEMTQLPTNAPNPEAPVCPGGQTAANLYFDDLENTASGNWVRQTNTGPNRWFYPQNPNTVGLDATYATSGDNNLWGYDRPGVGDYSFAMTSSTALPAGSTPYLRFDHAFGFDDDNNGAYDGGVLEYSTNNGTTWNDAGSLPRVNGYTGTITSGFSNPLQGRSAFVRESNGYISSRFALSSLAGKNVRFRFRIGTDNTAGIWDYGWFVDDVSIYTCGGSGNQPPTDVEVGGFTQPWIKNQPFPLTATAQDPDGIDFYDVTSRVASVNGNFQAPQVDRSQNGNFTVTMPNGATVCFTATATDNLGATSSPSDEECTAVPANNTSFAHKKRWSKKTASGHYLNSFSTTKRKGAALHLNVRVKRLALVATKCNGCGTVKVLLGNQLLKKINLNASTTKKKRFISVKTFGSVRSGTVKIVVASRGKTVKIEGLGVSKR